MAYKLRYFTSFYGTADKRTDNLPDLFEMQILELDGVDDAEELEASEFPVIINYQNSGDNKLLPFRGSWAGINLLATGSFHLENLYTDNERKWLISIRRISPILTIEWELNETPPGENVDFNLFIYVNGVQVVNAFNNASGSFLINKGDTIRAETYQYTPAMGITGGNIEITGIPTQRSVITPFSIDTEFTPDSDTRIYAYSTYSATEYTAIRSQLFYRYQDGRPIVFTKTYVSIIDQGTAQALADADTGFDFEGQNYANSSPGYPAIWKGFIIPDGCQEQFYFPPYVVSLNAVDGLGLLKNLSFVQNTGDIWIGKKTWIQVIYACLNRIGVPDMDIYTCVNIYEVSMTQGDEYDPLALSYVNSERYFKDDGVTPMNCQEVLESILQEWTACIIQSEGHWWIYRPTEAALSGTLVFRHYVNGIYSDFVSKDIDVLLGGESEGIVLAPLYHINADQLKMTEKPYKTASISYKYGVNPSVLDNPNLAGAYTEGAGDPIGPRDDVVIPGWNRNGTIYTGLNPGAGIIFYKTSGFSDANYYQNNQNITIAQGRVLQIDISYESIPLLTTTDMIFGIELFDGTNTLYLQPRQNGVYEWSNTIPYFKWTSLRSNLGISSGQIITAPVPIGGIITFKIYPPDNPSGDIIYFKIDATEQRQDGDPVGEIHTTQQDEDYTFAAETINVFNGDDPSDFFLGTIFRQDQDTPTTEWVRRGLPESNLANPPEAEKQFLRIAVEEINRLYGSPFVKFEGSIQNYFNPLSRFSINLLEGKFMPVSLSYDLQANICKSVLTRVSNTEIAMDYTVEPDYGETTKVTVK